MPDSRAFKVKTQEGSLFVARLDDELVQDGVAYYNQTWLGFSERMHRKVKIKGIGPAPMPGATLTVDDTPYEEYEMAGERIPRYPTERILEVVELPLPELAHPSAPEEVPRDP
jgi:hypothetical protein